MSAPNGNLLPAAGGLIEIISHLHALRFNGAVRVETTNGHAMLSLQEGTVRQAIYHDRAGLTALTGACLLATGEFSLMAVRKVPENHIGLMTPALIDLLRTTTAQVRSDYAGRGQALPNDPLLGVPIPYADTTTDELLSEAKLTVRRRSDDDDPSFLAHGETGATKGQPAVDSQTSGDEFPDDFLSALVPDDLRGDQAAVDGDFARAVTGQAPSTAWQPPPIGQMLGKCYLTAEVGVGSSAIVYRALHLSLKVDVAVKVLTPNREGGGPRHLDLREAQTLARLSHPNVLRVLDCSDEAPYPHVVMEYVDGQTLASMIAQAGRLAPATALGVALQAAEGLAYASAEGVTHNDVKPGNLLVSRSQQVKVCDLGVARATFHEPESSDGDRAVVGTPAYIAPELVVGGIVKASPKSDIYSLGATLYHALTGRPPFIDADPIRLMLLHVKEPLVPASLRVEGLDPRLDALVTRLLDKDPEQRPDYESLLVELHTLRSIYLQQGAIGPGLARDEVPSTMLSTLSTAWRTVRSALDRVLQGGSSRVHRPHSGTNLPRQSSISGRLPKDLPPTDPPR
jgi:serine/threonine protein kinase